MNVLDLFCGIGGLSDGFKKNDCKIIVANEIDSLIAKSYKLNHSETVMLNKDINEIIPDLHTYKNNIDIIIGGPPCQGFSMAGARIRTKNEFLDDPRNYLFRSYFEVVKTCEPKYFVMENVPGLLSMNNGDIYKEIVNLFSDESNFKNGKYHLFCKIMNARTYGVPQTRSRLIILGSKKKVDFDKVFNEVYDEMVKNKEIVITTIGDAISDLNFLNSGEGNFESDYKIDALTLYQKRMRKNSLKLYNHIATNHNKVAISRMSELSQGGRRIDLKEGGSIKSVHSGAYGRMRWDEPAKTIITRFDTPSSGVYIHPELNRTITPREAARLQSFDDNYIFHGPKSSVIKQIGNAVPPLLSFYLAKVIMRMEDSNDD